MLSYVVVTDGILGGVRNTAVGSVDSDFFPEADTAVAFVNVVALIPRTRGCRHRTTGRFHELA